MAQITWRNVDAPESRGALDGIRTFGALLGASTDTLSRALGSFQAADQNAAGNEVLQRALSINDPTAYNRAMSDGSILGNVNASRLSPETIAALGQRQSDLVRQAGQQLATQKSQYDFNRQQLDDARLTAGDRAIRNLNTAALSNNPQAYAAAYRDAEATGLTAAQLAEATKVSQGIQGAALGNNASAFNALKGQYEFGKTVTNDAAQALAADVLQQARAGAVTERGFQENLGSMWGNLSPEVRRILAPQLGLGMGAVDSGIPQASAPGTAGTRQGNSYDVTYKFTPTDRPLTSMSMGDVTAMQSGMISSLGGSPVGRYQFTKATLEEYGPKVLGDNWRDQPLSAANQEKLAEALYNDRRGGDITKTWAALTNKTPGAYKDIPWSQARQEIAQGEVGARDEGIRPNSENAAQADIATSSIKNRNAQEGANSLLNNFDRAISDTRSRAEILNSATAKDGAFPGASPQWIAQNIKYAEEVGKDLGVTVPPAVAMLAMAESVGEGRTSAPGRAWDWVRSGFGGVTDNDPNTNIGIDRERVKQIIQREYAEGRSGLRAANAGVRRDLAEKITASRDAASAASAELAQALAVADRNPAVRAQIPRLQERVANAQARQNGYIKQLQIEEENLAQQMAPKETGTVAQKSPTNRPKQDFNTVVIIPGINPTPADLRWTD